MSKILVIEDESIVQRFLSEIAEENITVINAPKKSNELQYKNITLNPENYEVLKDTERVFLTAKEFEILKLFMENPKKVFSKENLLNSIWGYDYFGDSNVLNTHISNIRQKLGTNEINQVIYSKDNGIQR